MKTEKEKLILIIGLSVFLALSCGQEFKKKGTTSSIIISQQSVSYWHQLKQKHRCTNNGQGRMTDITLGLDEDREKAPVKKLVKTDEGWITVPLSSSSEGLVSLAGTLTEELVGGSLNTDFFGYDTDSNDLIYLQKVVQEGGQVGYNMVLSLCIKFASTYDESERKYITESIRPGAKMNDFSLHHAILKESQKEKISGKILSAEISFKTGIQSNSNITRIFTSVK